MRLTLLSFLFFVFTHSKAQTSPDSLALILSGKEFKEWIASPWKPVMGIGEADKKKCDGGESYIFYKDDTVEVKKCENGFITKRRFPWKISREGMDNILSIGDKKFQIRVKNGSSSEVKLRNLVFDKTAISNEVILKYERY
jgi:hypothetical protein